MKNYSIKTKMFAFAGLLALIAITVLGMDPVTTTGGVSLGFALTSGFTRICGARSGGLTYLWLTDASNITSFTLNSSTGEYSAVTMVSGKIFYKFEFDQDTAEMTWAGSTENMSTKITKMLEIYLGKLTQTHRNRLQDLYDSSACGLVAIGQDANGQKWVCGYSENFLLERPMRVKSSDSKSGKVFTDSNGSVVQLETTDNELPRVFTGSVPVV